MLRTLYPCATRERAQERAWPRSACAVRTQPQLPGLCLQFRYTLSQWLGLGHQKNTKAPPSETAYAVLVRVTGIILEVVEEVVVGVVAEVVVEVVKVVMDVVVEVVVGVLKVTMQAVRMYLAPLPRPADPSLVLSALRALRTRIIPLSLFLFRFLSSFVHHVFILFLQPPVLSQADTSLSMRAYHIFNSLPPRYSLAVHIYHTLSLTHASVYSYLPGFSTPTIFIFS